MTELYKPFEDKFSSLSFKYDRADDLYKAMRTIHRLVASRDFDNQKTLDADPLGSALIDIAETFGKLDGRGTSHNFRGYRLTRNTTKINMG
tara:strand:+ start:494 stop:766 length:273 start_codon:yes stop_codon:yes gene_type:complete